MNCRECHPFLMIKFKKTSTLWRSLWIDLPKYRQYQWKSKKGLCSKFPGKALHKTLPAKMTRSNLTVNDRVVKTSTVLILLFLLMLTAINVASHRTHLRHVNTNHHFLIEEIAFIQHFRFPSCHKIHWMCLTSMSHPSCFSVVEEEEVVEVSPFSFLTSQHVAWWSWSSSCQNRREFSCCLVSSERCGCNLSGCRGTSFLCWILMLSIVFTSC